MKVRSVRKANVSGKRVLMRVDFNVPLEKGKVSDDTRIRETLPTIKYLLREKGKVVLMSHLGRPDGKVAKDLRLDPVAKQLSKLLKKPVKKLDDCIGPKVEKEVAAMKPGSIILLENTRFHAEEEKCDAAFSKKLAALGDLFVVDAFGTAHRAHASTFGVAKHLPAYAGFLMEKEVTVLGGLMEKTKRPLTLVIGGAKIDTKIGLIRSFLNKADYFIVGGGLANTFLAAEGFDIGKSLYEKDKVGLAQDIMLEAEVMKENFVLPVDAVVADDINDKAITLTVPVEDVEGNMKILDVGKKSLIMFAKILKKSKTIIWNGPLGLYEKKPFAHGTHAIARELATLKKAQTILGGGDTVDAINHFGISGKKFTHISTGGGAMLEFLEGTMLPGVEIVLEKPATTQKGPAKTGKPMKGCCGSCKCK
jgi:phosphoglycerate kinase